jgi:exodeoxyribonuclease VII large subunit
MPDSQTVKTNVPEFSVSELAFSLKRTLEENYGRVRVRGELSRVMIAGSGHMYSTLKDEGANIDAVCWKGTLSKLSVKPEEGLEVICTGRVSSYPASSKYQLVIESMELAGEGALLKMLEERRKKLAAEGLFDESRKRAIPFLPEVIGVVTSPTGAVIRDILHRLADRFPRHVLVWPVLVQGQGAAQQIADAIQGFQDIDAHGLPRPDVIIVARGGGSLEDLMAFNEEIVVRAAANSKIPLISAVGHETDTTLIDYAADLRAPTPTGAAEMAVPRRADLMAQILEDEKRLIHAMTRMTSEYSHRLDAQAARLGDPKRILEVHMQRLDHLGDKLSRTKDYLREKQQIFARWAEHLETLAPRLLKDFEKRVDHAGKMLEAYGFENVLERGFALVQTSVGHVVTDATQLKEGQDIKLRFKQNTYADAVVKKMEGNI